MHIYMYTHTRTCIDCNVSLPQIQMVTNQKTGKPCGYAFIVYEKERDMHGTATWRRRGQDGGGGGDVM